MPPKVDESVFTLGPIRALYYDVLDFLTKKQKTSPYLGYKFVIEKKANKVMRVYVESMITYWAESAKLLLLSEARGRVRKINGIETKIIRKTLYEKDMETVLRLWSLSFGKSSEYEKLSAQLDRQEQRRKQLENEGTNRQVIDEFNRRIELVRPHFSAEDRKTWNAYYNTDLVTPETLQALGNITAIQWVQRKGKLVNKYKQYFANVPRRGGATYADIYQNEYAKTQSETFRTNLGMPAGKIQELITKGTYTAANPDGMKLSGPKTVAKAQRKSADSKNDKKQSQAEKRGEYHGAYNLIRHGVWYMVKQVLSYSLEYVEARAKTKDTWNKLTFHQITLKDLVHGMKRYGVSESAFGL